MTARRRCGWVKFLECGKLLHGNRLPLRLNEDVCKGCVKPAIFY